jgi:putative nucleotidyltransferase with HDIG domain
VFFYLPLIVTKVSLQKYIDLWETYNEMAAALSIALDARDSYTHGHSVRVSEYSAKLAKYLGLSDEEVELIRYVGLLHDVGKVGMPDSLLKKEGPYTYHEYEAMKKHSEVGADIIKVMKFLGKREQWVRHHHERWDGTGFPDGLAGDEIPLGARIIACADAFDAMTTDRPYKDKMSYEEARQELLICSETQFDPKVVEAMVKIIDHELLRK